MRCEVVGGFDDAVSGVGYGGFNVNAFYSGSDFLDDVGRSMSRFVVSVVGVFVHRNNLFDLTYFLDAV